MRNLFKRFLTLFVCICFMSPLCSIRVHAEEDVIHLYATGTDSFPDVVNQGGKQYKLVGMPDKKSVIFKAWQHINCNDRWKYTGKPLKYEGGEYWGYDSSGDRVLVSKRDAEGACQFLGNMDEDQRRKNGVDMNALRSAWFPNPFGRSINEPEPKKKIEIFDGDAGAFEALKQMGMNEVSFDMPDSDSVGVVGTIKGYPLPTVLKPGVCFWGQKYEQKMAFTSAPIPYYDATYTADGIPPTPVPPTPVPPTPVPPKPSSSVQERGSVGPIIFKPNETPWSNRGKISEGKGAYNTDVIYTGDLQIVYRGTVKIKERECSGSGEDRSCWWEYYEEDFEVVYDLDRIDVSGDASKTFSGQSSDIDITHEGENLGLDAIGTWQPAKYHVPSMRGSIYSTIVPGPPPRPKGHSGDYDIDWTMPTIEIDDIAHDRAINELIFGIDIDDNLEADECLTVTAPTEYGVDGILDNQNKSHRNITYSNIPNEDTIYEFHYDIEDEATNKRFCSFKTSIVKEYWEQMIKIIGKDLDLEVPIKFLSNSDTQTLKGFKRSKTINFDSWRGIPTEVWYKFTGKAVNFIRVIHYDDPKLSIIDENGNKLYPTDTEFKDSPGLANKIGVDVGSNMEITNYGRLSLQTPVKTVDNNDGTITNYYMNGDVRTIDKATGKLVKDRQKGYGEILNDLTEHIGNKTIYRTGNRYIITITDCGSYSDMLVQDRNLNTVEHTKINR